MPCTPLQYQNHSSEAKATLRLPELPTKAGEKLFSEYDQKTKNYTCKKEVVYTEIMLPPNAPPEYADRNNPLERR